MKKRVNDLPPPWIKGAKHIQGVPMLMVRMGIAELEGLDNLQGFPFEDPDTGVRAYPALSEIIEFPIIRDLFNIAFSQIKAQGHVSEDIQEAYEIAKQHSLPYRETPEEKRNPYIKALEEQGRGKDKKFAYIPMNLAELLIEFHGKPTLSPEGLLSFGWFSEIIRGIGTIGGAIIGGPLGAGAGNFLGRILTGNDVKNAAIGGLKMGALSYGAQGLGQAAGLTAATPLTAGFFGGAPNMLASGLGALGIGKAAAGAKALAGPALGAAALASSGNPNPEELAAATGATASPSSNGLDTLTKMALIGQAGLSYMGSQQNYKLQKKAAEREQANIEHHRRENAQNWTPVMSKKRVINPRFFNQSEDEMKHGIYIAPFLDEDEAGNNHKYAKGGSVKAYNKVTLMKGPGKGQDDFIKTSVPDGSWIYDASSTSMLGDGSSEAGAQVLAKLEKQILNKHPKRFVKSVENQVSKNSKPVPVWLSKDEVVIPPATVTVLGEGSNKNGADILRTITKNLRKHKTSNGSGLPPKAKHPLDYMKQRRA